MPKIVDAEQRRREVVEAVFRIIERGGLEAASLRNVAEEARLNVGSVRHYFASHDDLLMAAADEMVRRVSDRCEARGAALDAAYRAGDADGVRRGVVELFEELLPLDQVRRRETAVWLAFVERSRTQPRLSDAGRRMHLDLREVARTLCEPSGAADAADRAEVLIAGVDGLTMAALQFPDLYPAPTQRRLLRQLLRQAFADTP